MQIVQFEEDGVTVVGFITRRTDSMMIIEISSPYKRWSSIKRLSQFDINQGRSYLSHHGMETAMKHLKSVYKKIKIIDDDIDYWIGELKNYQEELKTIETLHNLDVKERITEKLTVWFIDCIFTPSLTGVYLEREERENVFEFLTTYAQSGTKVYIKD